jgi:hypothetical protein
MAFLRGALVFFKLKFREIFDEKYVFEIRRLVTINICGMEIQNF